MMTRSRERIDKVLVAMKCASSRTKAQEMLAAGIVRYQGQVVTAPSTLVEPQGISVCSPPNLEGGVSFLQSDVGRGATKIRPILEYCGWDCLSKNFVDCGASTGGFTQVLLSAGAAQVYAIDVGHGQLAPGLIADPRVINLEGINLKYPTGLGILVDYGVVDLSFISLRLTLKNIFAMVREEGEVLALWKPQFEVGRTNLGKQGVVNDAAVIELALQDFSQWCQQQSLIVLDVWPAPITGKQGNQEYFWRLALNPKTRDIVFYNGR